MLSCLIGDVEIFISQGTDSPSGSFHLFTDKASWAYRPIRHEFGPADITAIINFIEELHAQLSNCAHSTCFQIAYRADDGQSSHTNAVFLAGCYMILMLDQSPDQVAASFKNLDKQNIEGYRDSSDAPADFFLTLNDCPVLGARAPNTVTGAVLGAQALRHVRRRPRFRPSCLLVPLLSRPASCTPTSRPRFTRSSGSQDP